MGETVKIKELLSMKVYQFTFPYIVDVKHDLCFPSIMQNLFRVKSFYARIINLFKIT